jgi:hypothetical protein
MTGQPVLDAVMSQVQTIPIETQYVRVPVPVNVAVPTELARISQPDIVLPSLATGYIMPAVAEAIAAGGDFKNLKKITELPYALYLFGPAVSKVREDYDEEEDDTAAGKAKPQSSSNSSFLKLGEAVRMAAVLHNIYRGGTGHFEEETPWYLPYVRYAIRHGIVRAGEFEDYTEYATRAEAAYIFSGSVPAAEFPVLNHVTDIPDVDEHMGYGDRIYRLLRAGVITAGNGSCFYPDRILTREEAAAVIGRIATPTDRKLF